MRYEIRVDVPVSEGVLSEEFPELEPDVRDAQTVLEGLVVNEAQLYGLLVRFQDLGLQVVGFRRLD